jgi:lipoyl-dependent peroxiredoxin
MPIRTSEAEWVNEGAGGGCRFLPRSAEADSVFDFRSRMQAGPGSSPEELIGAAEAGCLSMALAARLAAAGFRPERVKTTARVHFAPKGGEWRIDRIDVTAQAAAPGLTEARLASLARQAQDDSPVTRALGGVYIAIDAQLIQRPPDVQGAAVGPGDRHADA